MKMKFLGLAFLLTATLTTSLASADEWSAPIGKKAFKGGTKKLPGVVSEKLDFGAYLLEDELVVFVRNGKHKMGASSIAIKCVGTPATLEVQRVRIAKPLSVMKQKRDGAYLFESFTNSGKPYEIFYHLKNGKLEPKITVSSKS